MKLGDLSIRFMGRKLVRSTILTAFLSGSIFLFFGASWGAVTIKAEPVVTGLSNPVDITHAGDGSGRLFIILQGGRIVIFDGVQVLSTPFLDITALVSSGGERGLLGAAFHPNYVGNGFFYLSYTDTAGDSVIARYSVSVDPNRADSASGVILLTITQPFSNHNGGQLQFGPDGYLYMEKYFVSMWTPAFPLLSQPTILLWESVVLVKKYGPMA
jgi:hypothetical protein